MKEYEQDIKNGEACYFRRTERGTKARPIMEVNGKLVYITPELLRRKQEKIDQRNMATASEKPPKFEWNPFWGVDARWE